jgi:hypothetical protein
MLRGKNNDVRVDVAVREAREFEGQIRFIGWVFAGAGIVVLAIMAIVGVTAPWLIVVSFGLIVVLLTQVLAGVAERNTAALAFLEIVCAEIDERTEKMHMDMPST